MVKIIPSILTADPEELKNKIARCEGIFDRVQIDINDGSFLGEKTIQPEALLGTETDLSLDFHLMVAKPEAWVEKCVRAGADRIYGQVEKMENQTVFVEKVQEVGLKVGLALDFETPVDFLDNLVMADLDSVLVMSYPAGRGGQVFNDAVLDKITRLSLGKKGDVSPYLICCDGAVWTDTIKKVSQAGADEVAVGGKIFAGQLEENLAMLVKEI